MRLFILLLLVLISPSMGLDVSIGVSGGGESASSSSSFWLDQDTAMTSTSNGWATDTKIDGSGIATHNGLFMATDDPESEVSIASAGQDVSITSDGTEVASKSGDMIMGMDMLKSSGSSLITGPTITTDGGRTAAYSLLGYRWNTKDPQLKWVLKNDALMTVEGLTSSSVSGAIKNASETWDAASNQNLFADSGLVTLNASVKADSYNKINTINWKPMTTGCNVLAYARTYYKSTKVDNYYSAIESDIVMNSNYGWRTSPTGTKIDTESILLHEMGHTLGLGDLYGKTEFVNDKRQVMHYYTGTKRTLGNGDKTGIWKLYG